MVAIQPLSAKLIYALECPENESARIRRNSKLRTEAYHALAFLVRGLVRPTWEYGSRWLTVLAFATGTPDVGPAVTLMQRAVQRRHTLGLAFNQATLVTALRECSVMPPIDDLIDVYISQEELRLHELRRRLFEVLGYGEDKRMEQVTKWADKMGLGELNSITGLLD